MFEEGSKLGVEGMVSKQVDKPYLPGNRGVWVKTKFLNRQEFVIVGWTDPEGSRSSRKRSGVGSDSSPEWRKLTTS